jgi:hypothetical protein
MRRFLIVLLVITCLSASGCTLPGDWWPFSGSDDTTFNSNTWDTSRNVSNAPRR